MNYWLWGTLGWALGFAAVWALLRAAAKPTPSRYEARVIELHPYLCLVCGSDERDGDRCRECGEKL